MAFLLDNNNQIEYPSLVEENIQLLQQKKEYESKLIVHGYIIQFRPFYPKEIIQMIYNFYFITIYAYEMYTIGRNDSGQQGTGDTAHVTLLKRVKIFPKTIKTIVNGYNCVYVLFTDNTYECCGYNSGQLGMNHVSNQSTFVKNNNIEINNIFTAPFSSHSFCIQNNNKIYTCGRLGGYGCAAWKQINTPIKIQKIATAGTYTTFLNKNGQLFVCGECEYGGLGLGTQIESNKITRIKIKTKFIDIYCGYSHTLALDYNGKIWSWGDGNCGRLGHGDTMNRVAPTPIKYFMSSNIKIIKICCGYGHSFVLSKTNKIYLFGTNSYYQLGNNNRQYVLLPQINQTLKTENIIAIKCGYYHNMAKNDNNKYYLWGNNNYHQCIFFNKCVIGSDCVKIPFLFESKDFSNKYQQIIDMFLGTYSTRVLIGNTIKNNTSNDFDEKHNL